MNPWTIASGLVLAIGTFSAPSRADDCGVCESKEFVQCVTCQGTLEEVADCDTCESEGKIDCPHCEAGRADCPNRACRDGVVTWTVRRPLQASQLEEQDPCKACRKRGTVKCSFCVRGRVKCPDCLGKRRYERICHDCAGQGRLPCPECQSKLMSRSCPWCRGKRLLECKHCTLRPVEPSTCRRCGGDGRHTCEECLGRSNQPCGICSATGKRRAVAVTAYGAVKGKAGVEKDDSCAGTGILPCDYCQRGQRDCEECERGKVETCPICRGEKEHRCFGCRGVGVRPYELAAQILEEHERYRSAAITYRSAQQRVRDYFSSQEKVAESTAKLEVLRELDRSKEERKVRAAELVKERRAALAKERAEILTRLEEAAKRAEALAKEKAKSGSGGEQGGGEDEG